MTSATARLASPHEHVFLGDDHDRNERRTWIVIAITATMMVVEITAGSIYGSMALTADGWHMSTHAAAMLIAALAPICLPVKMRTIHALPLGRESSAIWPALPALWSSLSLPYLSAGRA